MPRLGGKDRVGPGTTKRLARFNASCNLIRTSRVQQGLRGDVTATQHRRSLVVSRAVARTWMTTPYIASRPKAR